MNELNGPSAARSLAEAQKTWKLRDEELWPQYNSTHDDNPAVSFTSALQSDHAVGTPRKRVRQ
jgi:hypothetical protein